MISFIKQKIKNQLWLSLCLFLGIALLSGVFACQPMFKNGSLNKLLNQMFITHIRTEHTHPTVIGRQDSIKDLEGMTVGKISDTIDKYQNIWKTYLSDISFIEEQRLYQFTDRVAGPSYGTKGQANKISYMPNMEDHIQILKGEGLGKEVTPAGEPIPCLISESVMDRDGYVIGELLTMGKIVDSKDNTAILRVAGIFKESDSHDIFWYYQPNKGEKELFVSEADFENLLENYSVGMLDYMSVSMLDYNDFKTDNVDSIRSALKAFAKKDEMMFCSFQDYLKDFVKQRVSINMMLWVLELPIIGMVLAFIYMVASQIAVSEQNEIAMLKSRGFSRFQVILMYMLKSVIIAFFGMLAGVLLGYLLCKMAASTTDFLTFTGSGVDIYTFLPIMFVYSAIAALVGLVFCFIPVLINSKISIVEFKANYKFGKRMLWEKFYVDILLSAVSVYLLFNFNKNIDSIRANALSGNQLDPVIFLNTCLFIIAFGLVAFRLMHYLVVGIYKLFKKKWNPVSYVAFLQITRTFNKQCFITVFMILTVSMGLFNANAARTINKNYEDRITYSTGADFAFAEQWQIRSYRDESGAAKKRYVEPNFNKFDVLEKENIVQKLTRVLKYDSTQVNHGKMVAGDCMVMGIQTKEFGQVANFKDELNVKKHWFHSLNDLGQRANGVIISSNLAKALEVKTGDFVNIKGLESPGVFSDKTMSCYIVDIVDAFPGYDKYYMKDGEQKERYLCVVNYASMVQNMEIYPYEVWGRLAEGVSGESVNEKIMEMNLNLKDFRSVEQQMTEMKESPKVQITNGLYTLSFVIALILCGVGFLIYWTASIRQRELLFGVYRAMGLSVGNVYSMLILEHIFSTLLSIISGGIVGMATTFLFAKLFGVVYIPQKSNLDIYIYYQLGDAVKLFAAIAVMIIICLYVLRSIIKKMNITQALKLGED